VTVHGLEQARAVLRPGLPVTLLSAPAAAAAGGCLWWRELVAAARDEAPGTACEDILDCGDAAGRAMAALRVGQLLLILDPASPAFAAVAGAAGTCGATLLGVRPANLDCEPLDLHTAYGLARLERWLRGEPPCGRLGDIAQALS
jgi:hypothetical protein